MNYTEIEGKVREATNDDPWGPTGPLMQELAHATFTYEHFPEVMSMLWRRMLQDNKSNWRRTYKATLVLSYLVKNGSERVVTSAREHIYDLRALENYTFVDENGKDQGINVRHKVRDLIEFIQDDDRLREERKKAKKNKDKYIGMSSEAMGMGMGMRSGLDEMRHRERFQSSRTEGGYSDNAEYDYHYGEEKEDSDTESGGGGNRNAKRYHDDERSGSPNVVTSAPTFKNDDNKKTINIKTNVKPITAATSTSTSSRAPKKIDMGAAFNYGKTNDLGINSPTHRNTHSEDLFGSETTSSVPSGGKTNNDIIEDIFSSSAAAATTSSSDPIDDFDPRAGEANAEFGDFVASELFADFSSAFSKSTSSLPPVDNFLINHPPTASNQQLSNINLGSSDLFGNSVITNALTSPVVNVNKDLLSDFGDLTLNTTSKSIVSTSFSATSSNIMKTNKNILELIKLFENCCKIGTTQQREMFLKKVNNLVDLLPCGCFNICELMECHCSELEDFASVYYPNLLMELVTKFGYSQSFDDDIPEGIIKLIKITDNQNFILETFNVLIDRQLLFKCPEMTTQLVEQLLLDDNFLAFAFVRLSHHEMINDNHRCDHFLTQLVNIPEQIANKWKKNFPQTFELNSFCAILLVNAMKSFCIISKINHAENLDVYTTDFLSKLISRVYVNFNNQKTVLSLATKLLGVFSEQQIYRKNIRKLYEKLHRPAIEIIINHAFTYENKKQRLIWSFDEIIEIIKVLPDRIEKLENLKSSENETENLKDILDQIYSVIGNRDSAIKKHPEDKQNEPKSETNECSLSLQEPIEKPGDIQTILDSDDDDDNYFESYNESYNLPSNIDKNPRYLLDLIQAFTTKENLEDSEKFEFAMNEAERIVKHQLSRHHSDIAIDLLRIFISLDKVSCMENFDELKMKILIAVCSVYPKECALYLCEQFNEETTKYSINKRMIMLEILAETAKQLSNLHNENKSNNETTKPKFVTTKNKLFIKLDKEIDKWRRKDHRNIIRERLLIKSRRFATQTKHPENNSGTNRFSDIAGWFFFPLMFGFGRKQMTFKIGTSLGNDTENLLLMKFLDTIAVFMLCAENSPNAPKIAKEIIQLSVFLRYHEESRIRLSVFHLMATVFLALPQTILINEFTQEIEEFCNHLSKIVRSPFVSYEPDEECRKFAAQLLGMFQVLF
ncbi:CLUMA_CG014280, isoform A [Clunio marinus]|uniref:CLUMA_CG014280, isoform A n=1 Tax=Clunio marinus TaxID=568069 RepID=A0A1J1IN14_9DIPT|nr:CLUMA_CG014280, isoform A [Clunio marinus]